MTSLKYLFKFDLLHGLRQQRKEVTGFDNLIYQQSKIPLIKKNKQTIGPKSVLRTPVFKEPSYPTGTSRRRCLFLMGRSGLPLMTPLILYRLIWRSRVSWYARMSFWSRSGRKNVSVTFFYSKNSSCSARPGRQRSATTRISTNSHLRYTKTPLRVS